MPVKIAVENDIPALVALLNSAYRGEHSKSGWTTEADLFEGNKRTDEDSLKRLMNTPGAVFLKVINEAEIIEGCVFLHKKENRLYLGMLSVSPTAQAKGIGGQLLIEAEHHAAQQGCSSIYMSVISLRKELISWYERKGYGKTGEIIPFPDDKRFGIPLQTLEMLILEKKL
jgi:ribosomal protein S18 acetylase RimI-like enzyme